VAWVGVDILNELRVWGGWEMPTIKYDDLEMAFHFVSGGDMFDAAAYISRGTGTIYLDSSEEELGDSVPDDIGDADWYAEVPARRDLDLGSTLVFKYVAEVIPGRHDEVAAMFRRKGAYGRFKEWLASQGRLDEWFDFENAAVRETLTEWAAGEGFKVE
jgi:hypothetical protein